MALYTPPPIITAWTAYTPTFTGLGTTTGVSVYSRRVGDSLEVQGTFTAGTATATTAQMTVGYNGSDSNVTVDTGKAGATRLVGQAVLAFSSATYFANTILSPPSNASYVQFGIQTNTTNGTTAATGTVAVGTGGLLQFKFTVPIVNWTVTS